MLVLRTSNQPAILPMNTQDAACPNPQCPMQGIQGAETLGIHSKKEKRFLCRKCHKTFAATTGTMFYRRHYREGFICQVLSLLAYGCPQQAIVATFELDERTVADWQAAAGHHLKRFHQHVVQQPRLDLGQVQADELRIKTQQGVVWMALAIMISSRLWLGGVVTDKRDKFMARALALQVRACALCRPLLVCFDGFAAYVKAFQDAFRSPLHTGRKGRPRLIKWPKVVLGQVIKRRAKRRLTGIERRVVKPKQRILALHEIRPDEATLAAQLLACTQGGGVLNTAYIERFNATLRSRLASLVRRTRSLARTAKRLVSGMYLVGCVYNFCTWHQSLRRPLYVLMGRGEQRRWVKRTPAMAAGLTDHRWTVLELMNYKLPPTAVAGLPGRRKPSKTAVLALAA